MSWTTLLNNDDNPIKKLYVDTINGLNADFNNLDVVTINGNPAPVFSDVITDSTDAVLTDGNVIVGDGALKIKQTDVNIDAFNDISNVDVLNCTTVDCQFTYSSDVICDYTRSSELVLSGGLNRLSIKDSSTDTLSSTISAPTLTASRILTVPDATGTIALTSQLTTNPVTSSSTITANRLVRGEDGSRGVQQSGITCDNSNNLTGVNSITTSSVSSTGSLSISSATNTDLNLDSQGTGKINFNTVQAYGVVVNATGTLLSQIWKNGNNAYLAIGHSAPNGDLQPTIAGITSNGLGYTSMCLRDKVTIGGSFPFSWLSDCNLGVEGNIKTAGVLKSNGLMTQTGGNVMTVPNLTGTLAVTGASQTVSFGDITSTTSLLNGITIPSSGGTLAKLTDIPAPPQKFMSARVNSDTSVAYKSSGPSLTFATASGSGVYNCYIEAGYIIRSLVANSSLSGGARICNVERVSDTRFDIIIRTVAEVGTDSSFMCVVYYD